MENEPASNEIKLELDAEMKEAAARLRALDKNIVASYIESGQLLQKIKDRLDHGQFGTWIKDVVEMSPRTAEIRMSMAKFAGQHDLTPEQLHNLNVTSLEKISAPSCPPAAVAEVLGNIKSGTAMKHKEVKDAIDRAKGVSAKSPGTSESDRAEIQTTFETALAVLTDDLDLYEKFFEALNPDGKAYIFIRGQLFELTPPDELQKARTSRI